MLSTNPLVSSIPQLRRNSPFGLWNLYAPLRALRPLADTAGAYQEDPIEICPFEPGREDRTDATVLLFGGTVNIPL